MFQSSFATKLKIPSWIISNWSPVDEVLLMTRAIRKLGKETKLTALGKPVFTLFDEVILCLNRIIKEILKILKLPVSK